MNYKTAHFYYSGTWILVLNVDQINNNLFLFAYILEIYSYSKILLCKNWLIFHKKTG